MGSKDDKATSDVSHAWWDNPALKAEDLLPKTDSWSLAADVATANILKTLSEKLLTKGDEVNRALTSLCSEANQVSLSLTNLSNSFSLLSDTQFVENRIYQDDTIETNEENKPVKTNPTPDEIKASQIRAVERGIALSRNCFVKHEISDSETEEDSLGSKLIVYKRINSGLKLRLPHIIGSSEFFTDQTLGIYDDSESLSVDSVSESDKEEMYSKAPIVGISSKILDSDSSESDIDSDVTQTRIDNEVIDQQSQNVIFSTVLPNNDKASIKGILSDSEDGATFLETDSSRLKHSSDSSKTTIQGVLTKRKNPSKNDKHMFVSSDSEEEGDLFCKIESKPAKRNRKFATKPRLKRDIFDSSDEESLVTGSIQSSPVVAAVVNAPDIISSDIKKPVGGINIFGSEITNSLNRQMIKDSDSERETNQESDSSKKLLHQGSKAKKSLSHSANGSTDSLFQTPKSDKSSVVTKNSATSSAPLTNKDQVAGVKNKSMSLFSDDDDLFSTPVSGSKINTSKSALDKRKDLSQAPIVTSTVPPIMKHPVRKKPANIFGSSSSDDDFFSPSILPRQEKSIKQDLSISVKPNSKASSGLITEAPSNSTKASIPSSKLNSQEVTISSTKSSRTSKLSSSSDDNFFSPPPFPKPQTEKPKEILSRIQPATSSDDDDLFTKHNNLPKISNKVEQIPTTFKKDNMPKKDIFSTSSESDDIFGTTKKISSQDSTETADQRKTNSNVTQVDPNNLQPAKKTNPSKDAISSIFDDDSDDCFLSSASQSTLKKSVLKSSPPLGSSDPPVSSQISHADSTSKDLSSVNKGSIESHTTNAATLTTSVLETKNSTSNSVSHRTISSENVSKTSPVSKNPSQQPTSSPKSRSSSHKPSVLTKPKVQSSPKSLRDPSNNSIQSSSKKSMSPKLSKSNSISTKSTSTDQKLLTSQKTPTSTKPSASQKPSSVSQKPSSVSQKPSSVSPKPSSVSQKLSSVSQKPSSVSQKPSSVSQKPSSVSQKPSSVSQKSPSVSQKSPSVSQKSPSVSQKSPSVSKKSSLVSKKSSAISQKPLNSKSAPINISNALKSSSSNESQDFSKIDSHHGSTQKKQFPVVHHNKETTKGKLPVFDLFSDNELDEDIFSVQCTSTEAAKKGSSKTENLFVASISNKILLEENSRPISISDSADEDIFGAAPSKFKNDLSSDFVVQNDVTKEILQTIEGQFSSDTVTQKHFVSSNAEAHVQGVSETSQPQENVASSNNGSQKSSRLVDPDNQRSTEPSECSVLDGNKNAKQLPDTKTNKKPTGGVAMLLGNELFDKIKQRKSSDLSEEPVIKEKSSDKKWKKSSTKAEETENFISPNINRPSKEDSTTVALEKGFSFDHQEARSTLRSLGKDRPKIQHRRKLPTRARMKEKCNEDLSDSKSPSPQKPLPTSSPSPQKPLPTSNPSSTVLKDANDKVSDAAFNLPPFDAQHNKLLSSQSPEIIKPSKCTSVPSVEQHRSSEPIKPSSIFTSDLSSDDDEIFGTKSVIVSNIDALSSTKKKLPSSNQSDPKNITSSVQNPRLDNKPQVQKTKVIEVTEQVKSKVSEEYQPSKSNSSKLDDNKAIHQPIKSSKLPFSHDLFDDDTEDELFGCSSKKSKPVSSSSSNDERKGKSSSSQTKLSTNLFSQDEDDNDAVSSHHQKRIKSKPLKKSLFDNDEENEELFGGSALKDARKEPPKPKIETQRKKEVTKEKEVFEDPLRSLFG